MKLIYWLCRRGLLSVVAVAVLFVPVYAESAQVKIDQVRATDFPSVTVRFTVSSPRGAPLPVLKPEDFVVTENGQTIGSVLAYPLYQSPTPLAFVIALDISGSMNDEGKLAGAKQASKDFIAQLRPIDQVEVLSFSDQVETVVPFTRNKTTLDRGIDKLVANGNTRLYDATDQAVSDVLRAPGTRVVVVLTDGQDTTSQAPLAGALDLAKQGQVPIYTIGLGSDASDAVLTRMADETLGRYFKAPKAADLAAVFKLLAQDVQNEYELTYFSQLPPVSGKQVNVAVRVAPAGFTPVEGQFSYVMPAVKTVQSLPVDPGVLQPVVEIPPPAPPAPAPPPPAPSALTPELAAILAFVAFLALGGGVVLTLTQDRRETRLAAFVTGATRPARLLADRQAGGHLFGSLLGLLAGLASRVLPARQIQELRQNLVLAGNPNGWGVEQFLGVRVLAAIGFAAVGYLYGLPRGPSTMLLGAVVAGGLGFLLPAIWLGSKIRTRQRAIFRAMPNSLDLIAVTVEAGLGFDQAIAEVCQKWHNELTREFSIFLAELQVGRDRREAMRGIVERTGVPELNGFVGAVIQADELGTGIARTLMIQAEQVRTRRRQAAEKQAHEAAVKMVFPLVFLIFPAIFVVLLGPAVPSVLAVFGSLGK
jgi:tight adherence protein C